MFSMKHQRERKEKTEEKAQQSLALARSAGHVNRHIFNTQSFAPCFLILFKDFHFANEFKLSNLHRTANTLFRPNSVSFQAKYFHVFFSCKFFVNANSIQTAQKHTRCHLFVCVSKSLKSIRISFLLLSHSISRVTFFCTLSFVQMLKSWK